MTKFTEIIKSLESIKKDRINSVSTDVKIIEEAGDNLKECLSGIKKGFEHFGDTYEISEIENTIKEVSEGFLKTATAHQLYKFIAWLDDVELNLSELYMYEAREKVEKEAMANI